MQTEFEDAQRLRGSHVRSGFVFGLTAGVMAMCVSCGGPALPEPSSVTSVDTAAAAGPSSCAPTHAGSGQEPDISDDLLALLEAKVCVEGDEAREHACQRVLDFRHGCTPNLDALLGRRYLGYSYRTNQGSLERELGLTEFREIFDTPAVAFVHLWPSTVAEFRDVPLAQEALVSGRPVPDDNVVWQFSVGYDIPLGDFGQVLPTEGVSLRSEDIHLVVARVHDRRLLVIELVDSMNEDDQEFVLWVFPLSHELGPRRAIEICQELGSPSAAAHVAVAP